MLSGVLEPTSQPRFWTRLMWFHACSYAIIWAALFIAVLIVHPTLEALARRVAAIEPSVARMSGIAVIYATDLTLAATIALALPGAWLIWRAARGSNPKTSSLLGLVLNVALGGLLIVALVGASVFYAVLIPPALAGRPQP